MSKNRNKDDEIWYQILKQDELFNDKEFLNLHKKCDYANGRTYFKYRNIILRRRENTYIEENNSIEYLRKLFLENIIEEDVKRMIENGWSVANTYKEVLETGQRFWSVVNKIA